MDSLSMLFQLLAFGLTLVVGGVLSVRGGRAAADAEQELVRTTAVVTRLEPFDTVSFTNRSRTAWYPVVRFTLPDGEVVETRTTYAVAPAPAQPGESETVFYDPADPSRVTLARGPSRPRNVALTKTVPGVVSIVFGIIALAVGGLHTVVLLLARAAQG